MRFLKLNSDHKIPNEELPISRDVPIAFVIPSNIIWKFGWWFLNPTFRFWRINSEFEFRFAVNSDRNDITFLIARSLLIPMNSILGRWTVETLILVVVLSIPKEELSISRFVTSVSDILFRLQLEPSEIVSIKMLFPITTLLLNQFSKKSFNPESRKARLINSNYEIDSEIKSDFVFVLKS